MDESCIPANKVHFVRQITQIKPSPNLLLHSVAPLHVIQLKDHLVSSFTHHQTSTFSRSITCYSAQGPSSKGLHTKFNV